MCGGDLHDPGGLAALSRDVRAHLRRARRRDDSAAGDAGTQPEAPIRTSEQASSRPRSCFVLQYRDQRLLCGFRRRVGGYVSGTGYYVPGYYGDEFWVPSLPDVRKLQRHVLCAYASAAANPRSAILERRLPPPVMARAAIPGPGTNVYAAHDGVLSLRSRQLGEERADDTSAAPMRRRRYGPIGEQARRLRGTIR